MIIRKFETSDAAIEALANRIIELAARKIESKGSFDLVLTGGSSPKKLYALLADQFAKAINWDKVNFFIGDERYVPADNPDYNMGMARETLLAPLKISEEQIFAVNTALSPADAASDYQARAVKHFGGNIVFDLILLGMGADAHTASIFPGTDIVHAKSPGVSSVHVAKLDAWRISMTAPLINQAEEIAVLAFGADKRSAFKLVMENPNNTDFPASLLKMETFWYVDSAITAP